MTASAEGNERRKAQAARREGGDNEWAAESVAISMKLKESALIGSVCVDENEDGDAATYQ
jgi:hypothetical protein